MTESKIVDFEGNARSFEADSPSFKKSRTLELLKQIPDEVSIDFGTGIDLAFERMLSIKNLVQSKKNPNLSRLLFDQMRPEWHEDLDSLILNLASKNVEEEIKAIVDLTLDIKSPTEATISKAKELVAVIQEYGGDKKVKAADIFLQLRSVEWLASAFSALSEGDKYLLPAVTRLACLPEEALDRMISVAKGLVQLYNNNLK
jgi:hypothetical protein